MSAVEFMVWTWFAWAVSAVVYIGYLRFWIDCYNAAGLRMTRERDEALKALNDALVPSDAEAADNDALLDALSEIVDAKSLPAAREIACNILDLPIYPELRRAS